jgi:hypothetical protein
MPAADQPARKRELLVSRVWIQVAALVVVVGFFVLILLGAGAALNHGAGDLAVLGATLLGCTAVGLFLLADFRSAPSGFPWPEGERSGAAPAPQPERSASSVL